MYSSVFTANCSSSTPIVERATSIASSMPATVMRAPSPTSRSSTKISPSAMRIVAPSGMSSITRGPAVSTRGIPACTTRMGPWFG